MASSGLFERIKESNELREQYYNKPTYENLETLLISIAEESTKGESYMKMSPNFKPFVWSEKENDELNNYKTKLDAWLGNKDWRDRSIVPNIVEVIEKKENAEWEIDNSEINSLSEDQVTKEENLIKEKEAEEEEYDKWWGKNSSKEKEKLKEIMKNIMELDWMLPNRKKPDDKRKIKERCLKNLEKLTKEVSASIVKDQKNNTGELNHIFFKF
jgi:hypothetical protein